MLSSRVVRFIVYAIIGVFAVSRMWVVLREYQDVDYSPLSMISTISLILMSIVFVLLSLTSLLYSGINRLILAITIISLTSTCLYGREDIMLLKQIIFILFWAAVFFLFYLLSFNDEKTISEGNKFYYLLLIPVTVLLLMSNVLRGSMGYKVGQLGNNMIFYLLTMLPWLLVAKERILRLITVLFVLGLSVVTMKRSAMTACVIITVSVIFLEYVKGNPNKVRAVCLSTLLALSAFGLMFYANAVNDGAAMERVENLEEDEGSGRLERYKDVIRLLRDEDIHGKLLLGHGYRTVEASLGESASAHNDFLEVSYDYGIIGLIVYALIHLALIKRLLYLRKIESVYYEGYLISYMIFFIMSMVSHLIIYPTYFIFLTSYWGAIEGHLMSIDNNDQ